ncbi:MAG: hypothetical protein ACO4CS_15775 [bacterium]
MAKQDYELIDLVVDRINWDKIQSIFSFLDWEWRIFGTPEYRVPLVEDLKEQASRLCRGAILQKTTVSAGGLEAKYSEFEDRRVLSLRLVINEVSETDYLQSFYDK